ncbi:glycoside hydrolase family 5 protein [Dothidotthia symphoricarpi CBS 119687]|uniref:Glycoside hydrolase family 5 protein n=1 Tax=Dothidotthia symphoricarpi CBS 119687 TaxID=1392245 RepID=A0A6A6AF31_9PLEO|nr:glycoside hydrolase family 5 protein [Dothidotthia symphoricarpi CBS 119687]KAF2130156.1 glycoside hydrolase family 5 protein [Dothidotthia symphoricarpi CBS 119687]
MAPLRLRIDGRTFRDPQNREVTLHGINCAADAKFPATPDQPSHVSDNFFDGDNVSFVNRPFSLSDSAEHFSRLRSWGYNTIRYIFTWEAIEHAGPGIYDEEWIEHTISILRKAKEYGFYIFMDPHQDVWSRFSGGSGAPMWTLYACGLNPQFFAVTEAALVQNTYPDPSTFPKMIWATNYTRMVCQVMFTLFFGGKNFAPKAIIDGKNIQDYLQDHYIGACEHLAQRIHAAGDLEYDPVIGWESMNEPNRGLIGFSDISVIPKEQQLKKGTTPTAWQAILTGSGRACEIDTWDFGGMGPFKSGSALIDPEGKTAWLPADYDESHYGWKRDPGWKLGECLWAQHGVWDPTSDTLLKKDYFSKNPENGASIDYEYFTNNYYLAHYRKYSKMVRSVFPDAIMFCQPPVLEIPPTIKGTADDDPNMVFSPHFYDGITLITKKWNRVWNVDVFGVLRGKYLTPAFAIKIGENAIRNCFAHQLRAIRDEGTEHMGVHPCVFTEIGIPYDMDDQYAYKTGNYSSQIAALDANHFALEESEASGFALWTYVATVSQRGNTHYWGDQWNGEDLSIYSLDDKAVPAGAFSPADSRASLDTDSPAFSRAHSTDTLSVTPDTLKKTITPERMSSSKKEGTVRGLRAAEAFIRPTPFAVHGNMSHYGFDLKTCTFKLNLTAPSSTPQDHPTVIYLPIFHFPETSVEASGGNWTITSEISNGTEQQIMRWWHAEGDQTLSVKGVVRKPGNPVGTDEEEGYLKQCQKNSCIVM